MKWLIVVKRCVPCALVVLAAFGVAACASPEVLDVVHQVVDLLGRPGELAPPSE